MTKLVSTLLLSTLISFTAYAQGKAKAPAPSPEAQAAYDDMTKTVGFVPEFMRAMPQIVIPGMWEQFKTLQMNGSTALL